MNINSLFKIENAYVAGKKYKFFILFGFKINISFLSKFKSKEKPFMTNKHYGKIYYPPYYGGQIRSDKPEIYNKNGELMNVFFIRDSNLAHCPYDYKSKYFLWDRYNFALDTHFYTGIHINETMAKPLSKFALLIEPREIEPHSYELFELYKGINREFDKVLSCDEKLLDDLDNAFFFNYAATIWCYQYGDTQQASIKTYEQKSKNLSMICSGKTLTELHKIRNHIADEMIKFKQMGGGIDLFGAYFNKPFDFKSKTLTEYRYQIVVENNTSKFGFTEKILDCFISMCVPIYLGASDIRRFFNIEGIIVLKFDDINKIENILKQCNKQDYENRLEAIKDNYQRSLKYLNVDDRMFEELFK